MLPGEGGGCEGERGDCRIILIHATLLRGLHVSVAIVGLEGGGAVLEKLLKLCLCPTAPAHSGSAPEAVLRHGTLPHTERFHFTPHMIQNGTGERARAGWVLCLTPGLSRRKSLPGPAARYLLENPSPVLSAQTGTRNLTLGYRFSATP